MPNRSARSGASATHVGSPLSNHLLAALPSDDLAAWLPRLEPVELPLEKVLYESGSALSHVYFPTTAIVSLRYLTEDGGSAELAVVGNVGLVGISLFMGGKTTLSQAVVQSAGHAYRLPAAIAESGFNRSAAVMHLFLRYTQALITQVAQTGVCNRYHTIEQQLCRCLLMRLDRSEGTQLAMTQEWIADMLGVRREGVTEAAVKLQRAGMIRYARGHIDVVDRMALEDHSCECYAVVKKEYERLLPKRTAT